MIKTAQYYWDKVAMAYFVDRNWTLCSKLEEAEKYLSKDEYNHLKELIKEKEE